MAIFEVDWIMIDLKKRYLWWLIDRLINIWSVVEKKQNKKKQLSSGYENWAALSLLVAMSGVSYI